MDQERFLQAFLQHRSRLFGFIHSILRERDLTEDLLQDVAVVAFGKCATFQDGTDFGAWLREIARRCILKAREKGKRPLVLLEPEAIEAICLIHDRMTEDAWKERELALRGCVEKLTERGKQIIESRYGESLGFEEIASRYQTTANSVQVTLTKLRKALRRCVENQMAHSAEGLL